MSQNFDFDKLLEEDSSCQTLKPFSDTKEATDQKFPAISSRALVESKPAEADWLIESILPKGSILLLAAQEGHMKTWLCLRLGYAVATGNQIILLGTKKARVLYVDMENPHSVLGSRVKSIGLSDQLDFWTWFQDTPPPDSFADPLWAQAANIYDLIVIDSFKRFMGKYNENDSSEMAKLTGLLRPLTKNGCSIILLHHRGKAEDSRYRGSSEIGAGVDIVLQMQKKDGCIEIKSEKHRWLPDFSLCLRIKQNANSPYFENVTEQTKQEQFHTIQQPFIQTLEIMKQNVGPPLHQATLLQKMQDQRICNSRSEAQRVLDKGDEQYWSKERKGNKVFYRPKETEYSVLGAWADSNKNENSIIKTNDNNVDNQPKVLEPITNDKGLEIIDLTGMEVPA